MKNFYNGEFAHIPGGGPKGTTCRECGLMRPINSDKGRCLRAAQMRRVVLAKLDPVNLGTPSCKYYEPK